MGKFTQCGGVNPTGGGKTLSGAGKIPNDAGKIQNGAGKIQNGATNFPSILTEMPLQVIQCETAIFRSMMDYTCFFLEKHLSLHQDKKMEIHSRSQKLFGF